MIGDGVCQPQCYWPACSYDGGDCNTTQACHCPMSWLGNGHCDVECSTPSCDMDGGDCDCDCTADIMSLTAGCKQHCGPVGSCQANPSYADGYCDEASNKRSCSFDHGDCQVEELRMQECGSGCPVASIADGICDAACNTANCLFDGEDCNATLQCQQGCQPWELQNGFCDLACNVQECGFESADCFDCRVNGCTHGFCDTASRQCHCFFGYSGSQCTQVDEGVLCHQRGVCAPNSSCGSCACEYGYLGRYCETWDATACLHGAAENGTCTCDDGWNGPFCTRCNGPDACGNHGTCAALPSGQYDSCNCDLGWSGDACQLCDADIQF